MRLNLSDAARMEMRELWLHYAEISEPLADRILHRIHVKTLNLLDYPEFGRPRPEFGLPGLRSVTVRPHVIFHSVSEEPALIVHHVVDGRRNLAALFGDE